MAVTHLSDQDIQDYLDDPRGDLSRRVAKHLEACAHCHTQLQQYQNLFSALNHEPELTQRFDFADAVMAKIMAGGEEAFTLPIWLAFFGMIAGIATTLYLVGLEKAANFFATLRTYFSFDWHIFSTINQYLAGLHLNLGLLALAIFTIAMMSIIDRFVFQSRHNSPPGRG
jgi:hypothetical protein